MLNLQGFRFIDKKSLAAREGAVDYSADNHVNNNIPTANGLRFIRFTGICNTTVCSSGILKALRPLMLCCPYGWTQGSHELPLVYILLLLYMQ